MITSLDEMLHIAFYTYNVLLPEIRRFTLKTTNGNERQQYY
jgi:hypothetical protein